MFFMELFVHWPVLYQVSSLASETTPLGRGREAHLPSSILIIVIAIMWFVWFGLAGHVNPIVLVKPILQKLSEPWLTQRDD